MSSRKTLDIDLLTLRKVYPVGPTNRPQPANTVFTVNSAGEGTWVNPIDNLVANGINPPLPTQLSTMQSDIATLNGAVFGGIDPHDEFVTKTEFMSTLVSPLPATVLASKGIIAGPDPSNNMLGIVSKSGVSVQNSGFNYWIATGGSAPLKEILTTTDFVTFTGQSDVGVDFDTAPSGMPQCYTVETNGSIWVAGGTSNNSGTVKPIIYSTDGNTWSGVTWDGGIMQSACYTIKYNGSMWIAAGGAGLSNPIYYSLDGITWSPSTGSTATGSFATIKALDYSNGEWYAIGDDRYMYTSINGTQWSRGNTSIPTTISNTTYALRVYTIPSDSGIYNINSAETLILIANSVALYKYNIGTNTATSLIPNFSCYAVETNGLMWVAVGKGVAGNTNKLYYTSDITATSGWTAVSGISFTTGTYVTWTGSEWLCTGNDVNSNNYIYSSSNGISWILKKKFDSNNTIGVEVINQILTLAPAIYVAPGQQRVGVFTTEPNAALDVQGNVIVRNNLTVQNQLILNQDLDVNTIYTNNIGTRTGGIINMNSVALADVSGIGYANNGSESYITGVKTNGNFAISYGASDVLTFDGSGGIFSNIAIAFNNPMTKDLQGRIATDSGNTGRLFAEAIDTFLVTSMDAVHVSAQFDVSGTMPPSITFFDPTTVHNNLSVTGAIDVPTVNVSIALDTPYANIPELDTNNARLTGTLDASNINVSDTLIAAYANIPVLDIVNARLTGTLDASNINVTDTLDASNVTTKICSINAGPGSKDTTLILGQADPLKYWQLYVTSLTAGGLTAGNFSLWSYDNNSGFIGRAIDIDASCSSITLCNDDVSGNVYVNGPSGPGRVYDTIYNPVSSAINNVTTRTYNTAGPHAYPVSVGSYSITIEYCGGGGGGGYTEPDPNTTIVTYGGGGGSGVIKKISFSIQIQGAQTIYINIGAGGAGGISTSPNGVNGNSTTVYISDNTNIGGYYLPAASGGNGGNGITGGDGGAGGLGGLNYTSTTPGTNGVSIENDIIINYPNGSGIGGWNGPPYTGYMYSGILYGGVGGNGCTYDYNPGGTPTDAGDGQDGYAILTVTRLS